MPPRKQRKSLPFEPVSVGVVNEQSSGLCKNGVSFSEEIDRVHSAAQEEVDTEASKENFSTELTSSLLKRRLSKRRGRHRFGFEIEEEERKKKETKRKKQFVHPNAVATEAPTLPGGRKSSFRKSTSTGS
ncbi:MAG: hypothetical protein MHM6MM_005878 [Cercozoa sp. M6MM]